MTCWCMDKYRGGEGENVVLVDHRLCVRPGQPVCMGVALPAAIGTKAGGEERKGLGEARSLGTSTYMGGDKRDVWLL